MRGETKTSRSAYVVKYNFEFGLIVGREVAYDSITFFFVVILQRQKIILQ